MEWFEALVCKAAMCEMRLTLPTLFWGLLC